LKMAFHCLPLSDNCKKYTGISSYFGGSHYTYERLPMGLNISPSIWQNLIKKVLDSVEGSNKFAIAKTMNTKHNSPLCQTLKLTLVVNKKPRMPKTTAANRFQYKLVRFADELYRSIAFLSSSHIFSIPHY